MHLDYPRPQFRRDDYTSLDGSWGFAIDLADEGRRDRWFEAADFPRTIVVPFPPESPASGIAEDIDSPIWYRREFEHAQRAGERLLLHFEGVDYEASVWVNGIHVGDHEGSQSRFSFDVTEASHEGTNVVVVRAVDGRSLEQPRGKQDWQAEPHAIWYHRTSGIWRTVWLERVPTTRLDRLVLTARGRPRLGVPRREDRGAVGGGHPARAGVPPRRPAALELVPRVHLGGRPRAPRARLSPASGWSPSRCGGPRSRPCSST